MSVVITIWVPADTEKFRQYAESNADLLRGISQEARSMGCMSHRFVLGDGHVLVLDEWESADKFHEFFADPQIAEVMQNSGALGEPRIAELEPLDTADKF